MANTYNLEILRLEVKLLENELENVVFQADWRYTATSEDEQYTAQYVGLANVASPDPDNFVYDINQAELLNKLLALVERPRKRAAH